MSSLEIVFIRHGESSGNTQSPEERAALGEPSHAFKLTERGGHQIDCAREYLLKRFKDADKQWAFPVKRIFQTSNMTRALESAYRLNDSHWERDSRLNEADRGVYGSMEESERRICFPGEDARQQKLGFYWHESPGGQNWPSVEKQVISWVESQHRRFGPLLAKAGDHHRLYVVGHGNWFQVLEMLATGRPYTEYVSATGILKPVMDNGSIVFLKLDPLSQFGISIVEGPINPWED